MPLIWAQLPSGQQGLLRPAAEAAVLWSRPKKTTLESLERRAAPLASGSDHGTGFWHSLQGADRGRPSRDGTAALWTEAGSLLQVLEP